MQRCCPLLSTCLGVSEETVVAGQQWELTYREGRSGAELSAWGPGEIRQVPPKPGPSTETSRPAGPLTTITSPTSSAQSPCRHTAQPPPLSGPSAPASLTRPVLHPLTPLLESRGGDCPVQGTEDWGHPGTYLSTEHVSCTVAVQGNIELERNWWVAPHAERM